MSNFENKGFKDSYARTHQKRFDKTLDFIGPMILSSDIILDLGPINPMSEHLGKLGAAVENTTTDLDLDFEIVKDPKYDIVTAFEILEHLVSPFPLLRAIKAKKLVISVPLKLWFAKAYWNENDPYDRHYHEFEPRQLDMLLEKAGWKILKSEKWKSYDSSIGIRPILRRITPRYYIVYCERT